MRWTTLVGAALAMVPLPAAADVTARYDLGKEQLSVEVDDSGDYRAEIAGKFMLLRRGGVEYVVILQGPTPYVIERKAFLDLVRTKFGETLPKPTAARRDVVLARGGEEQIAGRRGTLWTLGIDKPGLNKIEAVVTGDADLAPVAGIFAQAVDAALQAFGAALPESNLGEKLHEVFAKGAPLRLVLLQEVRLSSVSKAAIDPARFVLPGPVIDGAALDQALSTPNAKTDSKPNAKTVIVVPSPPAP